MDCGNNEKKVVEHKEHTKRVFEDVKLCILYLQRVGRFGKLTFLTFGELIVKT